MELYEFLLDNLSALYCAYSIRSVGYAVDTVQWTTDTAKAIDSQSDSASDTEWFARNGSSFDI